MWFDSLYLIVALAHTHTIFWSLPTESEVFLEAISLSLGKYMIVYISPSHTPSLTGLELGIVVVVVHVIWFLNPPFHGVTSCARSPYHYEGSINTYLKPWHPCEIRVCNEKASQSVLRTHYVLVRPWSHLTVFQQ